MPFLRPYRKITFVGALLLFEVLALSTAAAANFGPTETPKTSPTAAATASPHPTFSLLPAVTAIATINTTPGPTISPTVSPGAASSFIVSDRALPSVAPSPSGVVPTASRPSSGGSYRLAIPALGIDGPIRLMSQCGGLLADGGIWAWPCAGRDNLTLLAHSWGSFAPIYHGYHSGALRTGLSATYIDPAGASSVYYIARIWDLPVADALSGWASADAQSQVITLVACDDPSDSRRIIVRLIPVGTTYLGSTPTPAPVATPTASPSPTPTSYPTNSPASSPRPTPTPEPTVTPSPASSPAPTPAPTSEPTPGSGA